MLLILRIWIRYMVNIKASFLLIIFCITVQVEIRPFSQHFPLFFLFSEINVGFLPLPFLTFWCSVYCVFPVSETYYQTQIFPKNSAKSEHTPIWSLPRKENLYIFTVHDNIFLNFNTFKKDLYCFRGTAIFYFHSFKKPIPLAFNSNIID